MIKKFTLLLLAMLCIAGTSKADIVSTGEVTTDIPLTSFTANAPATFDSSTGKFTTTTSDWESIGYWIGDGSTMYATSLVLTLTESKAMNMYVLYVDGTSSPDSGANSTSITLNVDPSKAIKAIYIRYTEKGTVTISKVEYKIANVEILDLDQDFDAYGDGSYDKSIHQVSTPTAWHGVHKNVTELYASRAVFATSTGSIFFEISYKDGTPSVSTSGSSGSLTLNPSKEISDITIKLSEASSSATIDKIYFEPVYLSEATTPTLTDGSRAPVVLYRSITADKWSTIVLPFAMTSEQLTSTFGAGVSVAELQNTSTADELIFSTVSATEANKPYAIKVTSDFSSATIPNVTIVSATPTQSLTNWNFVGNYTTGIYIPVNSYYFSDNKLKKSTMADNHLIKPFRAYFTYTGSGSPALSRGFTIDGQTTGINASILENDEVSDGKIYNLNGQQIAQPSKGLYIKNGKKYIIK